MKLSKKLYKVKIGIMDEYEITHFSNTSVVARDVDEAIKKGRSRRKNSFVSEVELLHVIDKL